MNKSRRIFFRNCYWSFQINQKVFVLHLSEDGGHVKFSERTRLASFGLELEVSAAVWCIEILQELTGQDVYQKFFRKQRRPNYILLMEQYENRRGRFVRITKLAEGKVWNIIIPGGRQGWGWRKLAGCLDNLVGNRFWFKKQSLGRIQPKGAS